jgi:hypothetical protein
MFTALAAFVPEHVRNLSIHFCLSFASIARKTNYSNLFPIEILIFTS